MPSPLDVAPPSDERPAPEVDAAANAEPSFSYVAELKRKALHLLALVVPLGMELLGRPLALAILAPSALLALTADVWRAYSRGFNRFIRRLFGPLMRTKELPEVGTGISVNGATCVLVAAALLTFIFPLHIAVPIFVMVMIADAAAALVGRRFGRHPWAGGPRTVEGSAAFFLVGLAVIALFPALPFWIGALGVTAAVGAEAAPIPVNDNIRVPLVAAAVVALLEGLVLGQPPDLFLGLG